MKLHIFGASGSGVTTLGWELSRRSGIPYFDSDDYFWETTDPPFTTERHRDDRNRLVLVDLGKQSDWILGGSIFRWGDIFPAFDLVVFLWVPPPIRLERLAAREDVRYGDAIRRDPERRRKSEKFLVWAADYELATGLTSRTRKNHEAWLSTLRVPVLELWGDTTVQERIEAIEARIGELSIPSFGGSRTGRGGLG